MRVFTGDGTPEGSCHKCQEALAAWGSKTPGDHSKHTALKADIGLEISEGCVLPNSTTRCRAVDQ